MSKSRQRLHDVACLSVPQRDPLLPGRRGEHSVGTEGGVHCNFIPGRHSADYSSGGDVQKVYAAAVRGHGDLKAVGRIGVKALIYFEVVTTFALVFGLVVGNVLQPGAGFDVDPATLAGGEEALAAKTSNGELPHTVEFLLNIKDIRIRSLTDRPGKMFLDVAGEGTVTAG